MSKPKFEFSAIIKTNDRGGSFVDVPFDVEKSFGKKRLKMVATFDGVAYRGTLTRYGAPHYFIIIRKDIRAQIGKEVGDMVDVTVMEDLEPRVVEVPTDFQSLLDARLSAKSFYEKLSYTHQKEYINWITEAKRPETRERRMLKAIEMMVAGKKRK